MIGSVRIYAGEGRRTKVVKDATLIDKIFAITADGLTIHIPTGRNIPPPSSGVGAADDRKFVSHLLEQDRLGWLHSRSLKFGQPLPADLHGRLLATVESYPGD